MMKTIIILFLILCMGGCAYWQHTYTKVVQEPVYNEDGTQAVDENGDLVWKTVLRLTYASYHGGNTTYKGSRKRVYDKDGNLLEIVDTDEFSRDIGGPLESVAVAAQGAIKTAGSGL